MTEEVFKSMTVEEIYKYINNKEENLKIAVAMLTKGTYPESNEGDNDFNKQFIPRSVIEDKVKSLDRRIDYLDKELTKSYKERDNAGTETEIDSIETYIYDMEQERSIRHTQKYAYKDLL